MKSICSLAIGLSLLSVVATSSGQNLWTNGDFETPSATSTPVPGWTLTGTSQIAETSSEGTSDGVQAAAFNVGGDSQGSVLSQSFATTPGKLYSLSFDA